MGIFLKLFALIMGVIMAFFTPKTPTKAYEPETVTINGIAYKNCFIPEFSAYNGLSISPDTEPVYTEKTILLGSNNWYPVTDRIITRNRYPNDDLHSAGNNLYCRESDWNELKAYYGNSDNWNCFIGDIYGTEDSKKCEISPELIDPVLWYKMMKFGLDFKNTNPIKLPIKDKNDLKDYGYVNLSFSMISKDGLFCAGLNDILEYKNECYLVDTYVEGLFIAAYKFPDDIQGYIKQLTEQYESVLHYSEIPE